MDNTNSSILLTKISSLPDELKEEVIDFVDFLLAKTKNKAKESRPGPKFGSAKGMFTIMPDFDEPLEEFKEYME
jgi:hypothetical protein